MELQSVGDSFIIAQFGVRPSLMENSSNGRNYPRKDISVSFQSVTIVVVRKELLMLQEDMAGVESKIGSEIKKPGMWG